MGVGLPVRLRMKTEPAIAVGVPSLPATRFSVNWLDAFARFLVVAVLLTLILAKFRPLEGAALQFLALAIAAATVVQLTQKPHAIEFAVTAVAALAAGAYYTWLSGSGTTLAPTAIVAVSSLGIGTMIVLGAKAVASTDHVKPFLFAAFCPLLVVFTSVTLAIAVRFQPVVFDLYLYRFDASLGFQPSFVLGRLFLASPVIRAVAFSVYASLPLGLVLLFLITERQTGFRHRAAIAAVLLSGVVGFAFYQVCPALGPIYAFAQQFPFHAPIQVPVSPGHFGDFPRNAMPSLHVVWALVLWWNLRLAAAKRDNVRRWISCVALAYLFITVIATMGFGEHYAVDLVVAVPVATTMQAWAVRHARVRAAGGALALIWLVYLRFLLPGFPPAAPFGWLAVAATLALCVRLGWELHRFERHCESPSAHSAADGSRELVTHL